MLKPESVLLFLIAADAFSGAIPLRRQERVHGGAARAAVLPRHPRRHGARLLALAPLLHGSEHHVRHGQQPVQQVRVVSVAPFPVLCSPAHFGRAPRYHDAVDSG